MADGGVTAQSFLEHGCSVLEGVQLNELIGSGSYAKVYKGSWKGTKVAVKQLHEIFSDSDVEPEQKGGLLGTFYKELKMNMRLRHPNIIQFLGVVAPQGPPGKSENAGREQNRGRLSREREGFPMMVMELMYCTLEKRLEGYREGGTRMPLCKTIDIACDIAAALVYLHGQEPQPIAHRDLAPKNVLLSAEDTAKLCDLGVAKLAHGSMNNTRGPGTLPYMPPEVLIGTHYTPTAVDIYSFGVTLLEMCSGLEPKPTGFVQMAGESESMLCQMVPERQRRSASFSALPPKHPLEPTILKCLELKAENRPTAEQLLSTLLEMKGGEAYLQSKTNMEKAASCPACTASQAEVQSLRLQLEEQSRELSRLREENKTLKKFRDEQLRSLNLQLQVTAEEGERYQQRLQEMQRMLQIQEQMNHELEASNDRAMYFNQLLKQKVEMDNNPSRFSNPPPRPAERGVHSGSVKYTAEQRPKPVPKPRKRMSAVFINGEGSDGEDHKVESASPHSSVPPLTRVSSDPELVSRQHNNYLQLIAGTPVSKPQVAPTDKVPNPLEKQQTNPTILPQGKRNGAADYAIPLVTLSKPGVSRRAIPLRTKPQVKHKATPTEIPLPNGRHRSTKAGGADDLEGHIYVEIPASGPPTPPPRRYDPHRATWHAAPPPRPKQLGLIVEGDESLASPHPTGRTPDWPRPVRMVQSMKIKGGPFRGESHHFTLERPNFSRQGSRGDALISRVLSTIKSRNSLELSVTKGELVKVTNNAMDKKWCTAVTTTGRCGSLKKKVLEELEPVAIFYNSSNPALSRRRGVMNHIALCSSQKNGVFGNSQQSMWISPIETNRITITPSSLHSGEVNYLVKITDYLLCCTDSEEGSHFEIDLHEQRLLKLTGYLLQCHQEGNNGAPQKWRLEGSHNGTTWNTLSEEAGDFFRDVKTANYFSVTNPTPCRYFRLTQLGKNSTHNYRFCLSGIELYGFLYSSVLAERFAYRIY